MEILVKTSFAFWDLDVIDAPHVQRADAGFVYDNRGDPKDSADRANRRKGHADDAQHRAGDAQRIDDARLHASRRVREVDAMDGRGHFGTSDLPAFAPGNSPWKSGL
jgi:hypothetical protein